MTEKEMAEEYLEKKAEEYVPNIRWHDFSSEDLREEMKLCYREGMKDGYKEGLKAKINTTTISDCPIKDEQGDKEEQLEYAKTIIQDLLDNSDEYARQRAMDFLEEKE